MFKIYTFFGATKRKISCRLFPEHRWRILRAALPHRRRQRWRLRRRGAHGSLHSGRRWVPTQSLFHCRFPHCICTIIVSRRAFHTVFENPAYFFLRCTTTVHTNSMPRKRLFLCVYLNLYLYLSVSKCHCFPPTCPRGSLFFLHSTSRHWRARAG